MGPLARVRRRGRRASDRRLTTTSSACPVAAVGRPCHDADAVTSWISTRLDPLGSRITTRLPENNGADGNRSTLREERGAPRRHQHRIGRSRRGCSATRPNSRSSWHCRAAPRSPSGWTVQERQLAEVRVLRHDHEVMVAGVRPDLGVGGRFEPHLRDVLALRVLDREHADQASRQVLVEQKLHAGVASRRSRSAANSIAART